MDTERPTTDTPMHRTMPALRDGIRISEDQAWGIVPFRLSRDDKDRYLTRIAQDWFDEGRDAEFATNPVMPWTHDYSGDVLPVGRWDFDAANPQSHIFQVDGGLRETRMDGMFDLADEFAASVFGKYRRGVLSAVSVGFRSRRATPLAELPKDHPWRSEERGWALEENTLYEASPVIVPGHAFAGALRDARWLETGLIESAPKALRAMVAAILRDDPEIRRMVIEIQGDMHAEGLDPALRTVTEEVATVPDHPFSWLVQGK